MALGGGRSMNSVFRSRSFWGRTLLFMAVLQGLYMLNAWNGGLWPSTGNSEQNKNPQKDVQTAIKKAGEKTMEFIQLPQILEGASTQDTRGRLDHEDDVQLGEADRADAMEKRRISEVNSDQQNHLRGAEKADSERNSGDDGDSFGIAEKGSDASLDSSTAEVRGQSSAIVGEGVFQAQQGQDEQQQQVQQQHQEQQEQQQQQRQEQEEEEQPRRQEIAVAEQAAEMEQQVQLQGRGEATPGSGSSRSMGGRAWSLQDVRDSWGRGPGHIHRGEEDGMDLAFWRMPLTMAPEGTTCKAWLETSDAVHHARDFQMSPVLVRESSNQVWDCNVSCHFVSDRGLVDASFGQGGVGMTVLRSMEPRAYYAINDPVAAKRAGFQVVMTVHLDSDVPVGYFSWEEYDIMKPIPPKDAGPAAAVAFISNCNAQNFRLDAVDALMKSFGVDSYGRCATNMPHAQDKLKTIMRYPFCLAFENSCEYDYVTEKFWQSLVAGCVPVVVGAPNIDDFAPSNNSFFHIKSLSEVDEISTRMLQVRENPQLWNEMMAWKRYGPSEKFKALLDMSAVHSSCRLCIHVADTIHRAETAQAQNRPCRCREPSFSGGRVVYHLYVRERGRFFFLSVFLHGGSQLTVSALSSTISSTFRSDGHVPIWRPKRPGVLVSEADLDLRVYHIYPVGTTQREALYGSAWFQTDEQLRSYLAQHPCAQLEVIFV
eukprot:TRINITY_DN23230_c0_g1_i1.p1 TRINITY_DN23230_c0_g1~~TRINITY_DN23230_c0_g1_i1.p1  ORF type:complete len:709 (-),score=139.74 TRINITY_DN23230_c0_g1_i1:229-2355(-)